MAGFTTAVFDELLATFTGLAAQMSLHTADPGGSGASEVSGPGYSRQPVAWTAPGGGEVSVDGLVEFEVPAATTVVYAGFWDDSAGWLGSVALADPETFAGPGFLELEPVTIAINN